MDSITLTVSDLLYTSRGDAPSGCPYSFIRPSVAMQKGAIVGNVFSALAKWDYDIFITEALGCSIRKNDAVENLIETYQSKVLGKIGNNAEQLARNNPEIVEELKRQVIGSKARWEIERLRKIDENFGNRPSKAEEALRSMYFIPSEPEYTLQDVMGEPPGCAIEKSYEVTDEEFVKKKGIILENKTVDLPVRFRGRPDKVESWTDGIKIYDVKLGSPDPLQLLFYSRHIGIIDQEINKENPRHIEAYFLVLRDSEFNVVPVPTSINKEQKGRIKKLIKDVLRKKIECYICKKIEPSDSCEIYRRSKAGR